ncbi:hypothetical protein BYT27DRAFT_7199311 [Phlegmacium glaucopus]|nr:hypothetical protein BYT27DRAFT_7199311 [Phlegmacium glaucopus]
MTTARTAEYATCHPQFIESNAVALASTIAFRKEPIGEVLARINAAAMRQIDHTGTISLIVRQMIQTLYQADVRLCLDVRYEVVDRGISTYINYWKNVLFDSPHCDVADDNSSQFDLGLDAVDPLAAAAYIGDLYALGYLSTEVLKICVAFIVDHFKSLCHLRCVEVILERANPYPITVHHLKPPFLFECLGTIRRRANQLFGKEVSFVSSTFFVDIV